jgi:oligosaccharide repeat unit polymerase
MIHLSFLLVCGFGFIALLLLFFEAVAVSFVFIILMAASSLILIKIKFKSYTNLPMLLVSFSFLYGVSGPISAFFFDGIAPIFDEPYFVKAYLVAYILSTLGLVFAFWMFKYESKGSFSLDDFDYRPFLFLCFFLAALVSFFEIINMMRAGGVGLLFMGKAEYQSRVSELSGTLPSHLFLYLSVGLLGVGLRSMRARSIFLSILLFLLLLTPYITAMILLGRRGVILSFILVFAFSFYYFQPLSKIGIVKIVGAIFVFLFMGLMYGLRANIGEIISSGDYDRVYNLLVNIDFWAKSLSLGKGEFGAPFGNFNTYQLYGSDDLRFGATFVNGFAEIIPRFIWPNKPEITLYEFRNEFFPDEAERGAIASTGYSSLLEAYVNFGWFGIPFMYFIYGFLLLKLESFKSTTGIYFSVFYLMFVPYVMSFSRSSFSMPVFWPTLFIIFVYLAISLFKILFTRKVAV